MTNDTFNLNQVRGKIDKKSVYMKSFSRRLNDLAIETNSRVCIGLDPQPSLMPVKDTFEFNKRIVESTFDVAAAYKPQMAFYEALGIPGLTALEKSVQYIKDINPDTIIIGDCKRGDIGSTATAYAVAMFDVWDFDAITINVYQGYDAVKPFLQYPERGVFVVCRSSNPSATDFQDLHIADHGGPHLFQEIASAAERWDQLGNIGLVVGATYPDEIKLLRDSHPKMPFLIPGIGAQGGDLKQSVTAGLDDVGGGILINSSRGIIYASESPILFAEKAREASVNLRDEINSIIESL